MGFFDKIFGRTVEINNASIKRLDPKVKEWKNDLLILKTSSKCKFCGIHNGKVYSLYGWNKKYAKFPESVSGNYCPHCRKPIIVSMYFEGVTTAPKRK